MEAAEAAGAEAGAAAAAAGAEEVGVEAEADVSGVAGDAGLGFRLSSGGVGMVLTAALLPGSTLRALRRRFLGARRGGGKMRTPLACMSASCVQSGGSGTLQRDSAYSSATASAGGVACSTARLLRYRASNQAGGGWYLVGGV